MHLTPLQTNPILNPSRASDVSTAHAGHDPQGAVAGRWNSHSSSPPAGDGAHRAEGGSIMNRVTDGIASTVRIASLAAAAILGLLWMIDVLAP